MIFLEKQLSDALNKNKLNEDNLRYALKILLCSRDIKRENARLKLQIENQIPDEKPPPILPRFDEEEKSGVTSNISFEEPRFGKEKTVKFSQKHISIKETPVRMHSIDDISDCLKFYDIKLCEKCDQVLKNFEASNVPFTGLHSPKKSVDFSDYKIILPELNNVRERKNTMIKENKAKYEDEDRYEFISKKTTFVSKNTLNNIQKALEQVQNHTFGEDFYMSQKDETMSEFSLGIGDKNDEESNKKSQDEGDDEYQDDDSEYQKSETDQQSVYTSQK